MRRWKTCAGLLLLTVLGIAPGWCVAEEEEKPKLLGRCTAQQLGEEPYSEWFRERYDEYEPNPEIVRSLRDADRDGVEVTVFFGTWCEDSQREVPRLVKLLDEIEFPESELALVAVDYVDEAHKRSPDGEESGREIYKVPTIVVSRDGDEVARLVEHPVLSLERDLLAILSGEPYEPNYITYPTVRRWLREGLLADTNISPQGLAAQVRQEVRTERELEAVGRVLQSRGDLLEAVQLFRVNCALYPKSARAFSRLAEALHGMGEAEEARSMAEKALRLTTDPELVANLVELLERTKEPPPGR